MWLLSFLPDGLLTFIVHVLFGIGLLATVAGFFASKIPFISNYIIPFRVIAGVLLIAGIYFEGGLTNEMRWRAKVAELEAKLKVAEEQSKVVNTEIVVKYKDRVKVVTETQVVIQEKIKEVEKIIDAKCEVAPEAVDILNSAAKNVKPGEKK